MTQMEQNLKWLVFQSSRIVRQQHARLIGTKLNWRWLNWVDNRMRNNLLSESACAHALNSQPRRRRWPVDAPAHRAVDYTFACRCEPPTMNNDETQSSTVWPAERCGWSHSIICLLCAIEWCLMMTRAIELWTAAAAAVEQHKMLDKQKVGHSKLANSAVCDVK